VGPVLSDFGTIPIFRMLVNVGNAALGLGLGRGNSMLDWHSVLEKIVAFVVAAGSAGLIDDVIRRF